MMISDMRKTWILLNMQTRKACLSIIKSKSSNSEICAVLATLVDWKQAFPRQCPKLGIESFLRNGVINSHVIKLFPGKTDETKLLGTFLTNDLKWNKNT